MLGNGGRSARRLIASLSGLSLAFTAFATGLVAPTVAPPQPSVDIASASVGDVRAAGTSEHAPAAAGTAHAAHAAPSAGRRVGLPTTGQMVAFDWQAATADELRVRVRTPAGWSPWADLSLGAEEGPDTGSPEDSGVRSAGPVWAGEGADAVEVSVPHGAVRDLRVHVLRSHEPAGPSWDAFGTRQASATPTQPGIFPRSQWGADERLRDQWSDCDGPSYADNVRFAVVHHTVSVNTYAPEEADDLIRGIYAFHTQHNKWCDIGYNVVVDRYGRAWEGRRGGVERPVIGAHAGGFNTGSTGIALLGDHRGTSVTSAARGALRAVLAWKLAHHGVDAGAKVTVRSGGSSRWSKGTAVTLHTISGHRDVSSTACPGDLAYSILSSLRKDVQGDGLASPPYAMAGWAPARSGPGLLVLHAYGGMAPAGAQPPVPHHSYWPGWRIARAIMATADGAGYMADGWGGLHPFGGAPRVRPPAYTPGKDLVRALAPGPVPNSGYVMDAFGGVHPFGGAVLGRAQSWPGWPIGRDMAGLPDGTGGYVLDGWGGLHPFGTAPALRPGGYWKGWDIARAVAVLPGGKGGYVLDGWGGLHPFGAAPKLRVSHWTSGRDVHVDLALNATGTGGWILDLDGNLWPFGDAGPVDTSLTWWGTGIGRGVAFTGVVDPPPDSGSSTTTSTTEPLVGD